MQKLSIFIYITSHKLSEMVKLFVCFTLIIWDNCYDNYVLYNFMDVQWS